MKLGVSLGAIVLLLGSDALAGPPPGPTGDESTTTVASATSPAARSSQPLDKSARTAAQVQIAKLLLSKSVKSRIDFPGYKDGVDLSPSGSWSTHAAAQSIEEHGVGIQKGDSAKITAIKLHEDYIEVQLDGGGAGMFAQGFGPDRSKELGKVEGGSRINLRFERPITHGDVQDLGRFLSYLEPVVDTADIQHSADLATTLSPAKSEAPAPVIAEASTFGAPLLDPAPAPKPASTPKAKTTSKSGVAPVASKAAEIPSVPAPASIAPSAPIPAPAAAAAPTVTAPAKPAPKQVASTKIEIGADRMAVFQLLGQPGYKRVDVSKEVPIEKWQYDLPADGKRIITFENGKVLRVEDF